MDLLRSAEAIWWKDCKKRGSGIYHWIYPLLPLFSHTWSSVCGQIQWQMDQQKYLSVFQNLSWPTEILCTLSCKQDPETQFWITICCQRMVVLAISILFHLGNCSLFHQYPVTSFSPHIHTLLPQLVSNPKENSGEVLLFPLWFSSWFW